MRIIRSERYAAALLLGSAVAGLIIANTVLGPDLLRFAGETHPLGWLGIDLSIRHWISDGLLAIFFFIVAIELKHELVVGELSSAAKATLPAIAALGGVVVPAGVYLLVTTGSGLAQGWPIPTATDIAFALGVLAVFGKGIPSPVRIFLLALAVLDDLVAIIIIATFFTDNVAFLPLGLAAIGCAVFWYLSWLIRPEGTWGIVGRPQWPLVAAMIVVGILTWYFTLQSGVHATIAGVALGLAMNRWPGSAAAHALQPFSNGVVLPLFAFSAAMVAIPQVRMSELSPAFWGILIALPVGKLIGITAAGALGAAVAKWRGSSQALTVRNIVMVACLGGIGFTVSLLMNELAFGREHEVIDEGTLAVLLGSGISMVIAAVVVSIESRRYLRIEAAAQAETAAGTAAEPAATSDSNESDSAPRSDGQ